MEKTIFEKIANKEIAAEVIWEDENFMAFLDMRPFSEGHTLVIPKKNPGDYIFGMQDQALGDLMAAAKKVAKLLDEKLRKARCMVWMQGFEVPHVHVHLIPADPGLPLADLHPHEATKEELAKVREKIVG